MTEQIDRISNTTKKLTAVIEQLIPKSLDDIIRHNRDKVQLRLATDEEIFDLHQEITPGQLKDAIDDWNLVALHQPELNTTLVFLLGDIRRNGHQRITSEVMGVDLDRQILITKSGSLYQLGTPKNGAPDVDQLYIVCAAFHAWGFGKMLGVPHFFTNS